MNLNQSVNDNASPSLKFSVLIFNVSLTLFLLASYILFMLGTGGWTAMVEISAFFLFFSFFLTTSLVQIIVKYLKHRKIIIISKKIFVTYIIVILLITIFLILFNFGDCGDRNGNYNLIKKIALGQNACSSWSYDIPLMAVSFSTPLFFIVHSILLLVFSFFVNKKAQTGVVFIEKKLSKIFGAIGLIILLIIFGFILVGFYGLYISEKNINLSFEGPSKSDENICSKIKVMDDLSASQAARCFYEVAIDKIDSSICDKIIVRGEQSEYYKSDCYNRVKSAIAVQEDDINVCNQITDDLTQAGCVQKISAKLQKPEYCESLNGTNYIDSCYYQAIININDKNIISKYCSLMKTGSIHQQNCFKLIK